MSANNSGQAEFPFDKRTVFDALLRAIPTVSGMSVDSSDSLSGRIMVKAGMSLLSWGEKIPITILESAPNRTRVQIASAPKTGISTGGFLDDDGFFATGDPTFGKHARNVENIFSALSAQLSRIPQKPADSDKKKCPFCAELVQREAIKCRFCGSDISNTISKAPAPPTAPARAAAPLKAVIMEPPKIEPLPMNPKRIGDEIHFQCTLCAQPMAVDATADGQQIRCPECGEHLVIPNA